MRTTHNLSRRELLRLSAGSLLVAGIWPGALSAQDKSLGDDFHFIVVNDIHFVDAKCGHWLEGVVKQMHGHKEKVELCLVVGDLAEHGKADEIGGVKEIVGTLKVPTYVVVGNHDYVTDTSRKSFEDVYPDRINYHFDHAGWQFLGLDTTEGQLTRNTKVQPPTLHWLDDNLPKLDKKKPTIVLTHFPLGTLVPGRPGNAMEVLNRLKEFNLQAVFNGHWHGFTERHTNGATLTTNKCCSFRRQNHDGSKEKGYFLCRAHAGKIERRFVEVSA